MKRYELKRLSLLPLALVTLVLVGACSGEGSSGSAKSIILLIGDGMGLAHRDAIRLAAVGMEENLEMDSLPHSGFSSTRSLGPGDLVTDSAAGGTAIASGIKTANDAVGVNADGEKVATLLELAKWDGKSTGLVTTSAVTDATPAAFAAHVESRNERSEIARQYLEDTKPDVILGGGEDFWLPGDEPGAHPDNPPNAPEEGSRGTEGNLVQKATRLGYEHVTGAEELDSANGPKILGLLANDGMFLAQPEDEGAVYDPAVPLPEMTRKAIEVLSRNEKGFFLMVEEEAIDEMSHSNNAEFMLESGKQLDEAVGVAKDYAERHPDTLLVVAADHETGGLSIETLSQGGADDPLEESSEEDGPFRVASSKGLFSTDWTSHSHTAEDVPVTAMGPGAEAVDGSYENTHLYDVIRNAFLQEK